MSTKISQKKARLTCVIENETIVKLEGVNVLQEYKSGVIELALKKLFQEQVIS